MRKFLLLLLLINFKISAVILDENEVTDEVLKTVNLDLKHAAKEPHKEMEAEIENNVLDELAIFKSLPENVKKLKDNLYKKAIIEFDLNDPIKNEHKFLTFKLQDKDWYYYLNELKKIVNEAKDENLICLISMNNKCYIKNSNVKLSTIFDFDQYLHLKLVELKKLDKAGDSTLKGIFKDFMIGSQKFIDDFTKRIDSAKSNKENKIVDYSKDLLKYLLNIYKKVIKEAKDYYEPKLNSRKQIYTKVQMKNKIFLAINSVLNNLTQNKVKNIKDLLTDNLVGSLNKLNLVLKEVKTYVDDSGTKDLLCFVALTDEEKRLCSSNTDILVKYKNITQPVTIFYLNELLNDILALKLLGVSESKSEDLKNKFGIIKNINTDNSDTFVNNIIFKLRNFIKAVSTWRQGPKDAQVILLYSVDNLENIYKVISYLDSKSVSIPSTNTPTKNIQTSFVNNQKQNKVASLSLSENSWKELYRFGVNNSAKTEQKIFEIFDVKTLGNAQNKTIVENIINNDTKVKELNYKITDLKNDIMQIILEELASREKPDLNPNDERYQSKILDKAIRLKAVKWSKNKLSKDSRFKEDLGLKLVDPTNEYETIETILDMGADPNYKVEKHLFTASNGAIIKMTSKIPLEDFLDLLPQEDSARKIALLIKKGAIVKPEYLQTIKDKVDNFKKTRGTMYYKEKDEFDRALISLEDKLKNK